MKRIVMVCLGNICRSPLAEGLLRHWVEKTGKNWIIDSAGTAGYHVGEAPDPRTISNAASHDIDLSCLRARKFQRSDFESFDYIWVMDKENRKNVLGLADTPAEKKKVQLFLEAADFPSGSEVPDPYYGNEKDFERVFQLVNKACENIIIKFKD